MKTDGKKINFKKFDMRNFVELSKEEAILINGGGGYEVGKAIGKFCANCADFWIGVYDAIFEK